MLIFLKQDAHLIGHYLLLRHFKAQVGFAPGFKPIGQSSANQMMAQSHQSPTPSTAQSSGVKRSQESEESNAKIAEKKAKIAKFGLKFQSAGTLVTVNDGNKRTLSSKRLSSNWSEDAGDVQAATRFEMLPHSSSQGAEEIKKNPVSTGGRGSREEKSETTFSTVSEQRTQGGGSDQKFSFGFHKKQPTSSQGKAVGKNPPPLMSRQRELTMSQAFGDESDEDDDKTGLAQLPIRRPPRFKFNIGK